MVARWRNYYKRAKRYYKRARMSARPGLGYNAKVICSAVNPVSANSNGIITGFANLGPVLKDSTLWGKVKNAYSMFRISFIKVTVGFLNVNGNYQGNSVWCAIFPGETETAKSTEEILGANNCGEFAANVGVKKKCLQRFMKGTAEAGYGLPMSIAVFDDKPLTLSGQLSFISGVLAASATTNIVQITVDFYVELYSSLV